MKTKEIEVWVYENDLEKAQKNGTKGVYFTLEYPDDSSFKKAKLIIDLPEKKIEITESQFDEAWRLSATAVNSTVHQSYLNLKQKLFGDQG